MATTVGGVTTTTTAQAAALPQDVQSIITDGLNRLQSYTNLPQGKDDNGNAKTLDITKFYGQATVDRWKAPYQAAMNELANQQPPLTADEAQKAVDTIMQKFEMHAQFMRAFRKWIFSSMMKLVTQASSSFQAEGDPAIKA